MSVFPTATTITSTAVNSSHVFPISDGTARQEISIFEGVKAGLVQNAATSGAGSDLTIRASSAGSGNSNGGNLILLPGDNSGSGSDGVVIIRQPGGTAGTDQVEISHDGTQTLIHSRDGAVRIRKVSGELLVLEETQFGRTFTISPNDNGHCKIASTNRCWFAGGLLIGSGNSIGFATNNGGFDERVNITAATEQPVLSFNTRATYRSIPLTPSQITADQNNYSPGVAMFYRLSSDASRTLTGFSISQVDGQVCEFWNVGSNNIVIAHESSSSTAANRFTNNTGANITLLPSMGASLIYDSTVSRWRVYQISQLVLPTASSGAGSDLLISGQSAGSGNSNGGSLVLIPGDNAGSGSDGVVVVRQPGGTAGTDQIEMSHFGTGARIRNADGNLEIESGTMELNLGLSDSRFYFFMNGVSKAHVGDGVFNVVSQIEIGTGPNSWSHGGSLQMVAVQLSGGSKTILRLQSQSSGTTIASVPVTPSQLTADQNNYAPSIAMFYRLSSDASRTITGLSISQVDGQVCEFWNVGSNNIIIAHESTSSTAANRFICPAAADITLGANEIAILRYDATSSRWRVSKVGSSGMIV